LNKTIHLFHKNLNALLSIAAAALTWTVWLTRNEVIFDKSRSKSFLQVLFRGTHWLRQWAQLQRCEAIRNELVSTGQYLETSALNSSVPVDGCQLDLLPLLNQLYSGFFALSYTFL
jgi:hypothetical protein